MLGICFKAYGLGSRSRDREAPVCAHTGVSAHIPCECRRAVAELRHSCLWVILRGAFGYSRLRCIAERFCCVCAGVGAPDRQEGVLRRGVLAEVCLRRAPTHGRNARALPGWALRRRRAAARAFRAGGFRPRVGAEKRRLPRGPVSRLACEGDSTARQRLTREGRGEQEPSFFCSWWRAASRDSKAANAAVRSLTVNGDNDGK